MQSIMQARHWSTRRTVSASSARGRTSDATVNRPSGRMPGVEPGARGRRFALVFTNKADLKTRSRGPHAGIFRPRAGRGSEKTSRRCARPSVPRTNAFRQPTRRKRARPSSRYTRARGPVCRWGNRRHRGRNATDRPHGPARRRASTNRPHGRSPPCPTTSGRRAGAWRDRTREASASPRRRRRSPHTAQ